MFGLVLPPVAT